MVPDESHNDAAPNELKQVKRSNGSKLKPKPKLSLGLSLMHGFAADNIGKNRLTVSSLVRVQLH